MTTRPRAREDASRPERGGQSRGRGAGGGERSDTHGVVVIDKPRGPTSHDVVARARRALGTRRVGHAGTLDPMASGVLVVLAGEATKLAPFLTAHDKSYVAVVALGASTTTLDAEGAITAAIDLPAWLRAELEAAETAASEANGEELEARIVRAAPRIHAAIAGERARIEQTPPAYSAIKVGGRRSYDVARGGGDVELAPRPVSVRSLQVAPRPARQEGEGKRDAEGEGERESTQVASVLSLSLSLEVSKGYYVRSLARDIGERLGVPSHLAALRRTRSGPFSIDSAVPLDAGPTALRAALMTPVDAARLSLPLAKLTDAGAERARHGKILDASDFDVEPPSSSATGDDGLSAWVDPAGRLVAIGLREGSRLLVQRGFVMEGAEAALDDIRLYRRSSD